MKKSQIIRFIKGELAGREAEEVVGWIKSSSDNENYYCVLKNIVSAGSLSDERASREEWKEMKSIISSLPKREAGPNTVRKLNFYRITSYAAMFLLLCSVLYIFYDRNSNMKIMEAMELRYAYMDNVEEYLNILPSEQKMEVYAVKGAKAKVILPDSSEVYLNSDTKISYPVKFTGGKRRVLLSGEAYFSVRKNADMPMIVETPKNFKVEVTGTEFNLRAYDNDDKSYAALYSGKISLITDSSAGVDHVTEVRPNEIYEITDGKLPVLVNNEPKDEKLWTEGRLKFKAEPMEDVLKKLERWHGTRFIVKDDSVFKYNITASFRSESITQIMEILHYCTPIEYEIKENVVTISSR